MTDPVREVPPPNVTYGTVVGRIQAIVMDDSDADELPDALALTGTITLTPGVSIVTDHMLLRYP